MSTQTQTPVQIVQEVIAILTTRKEVVEKISVKELTGDDAAKLSTVTTQNDKFIAELMEELSNYGDGVMDSVDRNNEYHTIWTNDLDTIDTATPQEAMQSFTKLETSLKNTYQSYMAEGFELPVSLKEILERQSGKM